MGCVLRKILNLILFPCFRMPNIRTTIQSLEARHKIKIFSIVKQTCSLFIPYFKEKKNSISKKALIYFHGNAEELVQTEDTLLRMQRALEVNIFANQYPGYGIFKKGRPNSDDICKQAESLYNYVNKDLQFQPQDIIVVGRSIGTGPACHVAKHTECKNLVLISPFYSIEYLINQKTCSILGCLFPELFPNNENIKDMKGRLLNIHGQKDQVISYKNSQRMLEEHRNKPGFKYKFHEHMTHNDFHWGQDIISQIKQHFAEHLIQDESGHKMDYLEVIQKLQKIPYKE